MITIRKDEKGGTPKLPNPQKGQRGEVGRGMMGGGCKSVFDLLDDEHLTVFLMGKTAVSFTKGDH